MGELQRYEEAVAAYTRAIVIEPHSWVYNNRGNARRNLGYLQGAIADYNHALELDPDDAKAYYNRGIARNNLGDRQGAIADYNRALTIDENFWQAIVNIGLIQYEEGEIEAAIQQWQQAVAIDAKAAEPQLALAVAMYARAERGALAMAEEALELDSSWGDVKFLKKNLWGKKLVAEAQKLLETAQIRGLRSPVR